MGKVKANEIELNRKVLADLAMNHPEAFKAIVEKVKSIQQTNYLTYIKNPVQNFEPDF